MSKKEFLKLISEHKDKFKCLVLRNTTLRRYYDHCAVYIIWNSGIDHRTEVKNMRGKVTDLKCVEMLNKYKGWLDNHLEIK